MRPDASEPRSVNANALRTTARVLALAAVVTQVLQTTYLWWNFDPHLSCERLLYWGEWLDCLHGRSHAYVVNAEDAILIWMVAGLAMLFARFVPVYASIVVPGVACVGFVALVLDAWRTGVMPYAVFGRPELWDVLLFGKSAGLAMIEVMCPIIAGWLFGFNGRRERRRLSRGMQPQSKAAESGTA